VALAVTPVETGRDLDAFISLPWRIYADDPAWVPPLRREVRALVDREHHPFYRHGDGQIFLARRDGEVVGRILAELAAEGRSAHDLEPFAVDRAILHLADPPRTYMV